MLCARCRKNPASVSIAFRTGLRWSEAANVCQPCAEVMVAVVPHVKARIELLDTRPAWLRNGTAKDLTAAR